jgi:DNA-binding CsgD family transcriptional regulator
MEEPKAKPLLCTGCHGQPCSAEWLVKTLRLFVLVLLAMLLPLRGVTAATAQLRVAGGSREGMDACEGNGPFGPDDPSGVAARDSGYSHPSMSDIFLAPYRSSTDTGICLAREADALVVAEPSTADLALPSLSALHDFGHCLHELLRLARRSAPESFLREAIQTLQPLISFDAAWWGELSEASADRAPRNWIHNSIGLSISFAEEWNKVAAVDQFARCCIANLGTVVRLDAGGNDAYYDSNIAAFCDRHSLHHVMAITLELPPSGLCFFISLYRGRRRPAFNAAEAVLFSSAACHIVEHWQDRLGRLPQLMHPGAMSALAQDDGALIYLSRKIGLMLERAFPGWHGSMLPAELLADIRDRPRIVPVGKGERLVVEPAGPLISLRLAEGVHAALPPRELSVAMLYAQGHSSKAIARLLGLTPATVRTYLRNAYDQLDVGNKIELATRLGPVPPRP